MKHIIIAICFLIFAISDTNAFVVLGRDVSQRAWRWDAAPRNNYSSGLERSLVGGLRYSVEGGSLAGWYSEFSFSDGTTATDFEELVNAAFSAWTVADPVSGLTTDLSFVADFGTGVTFDDGATGAEIDLFASDFGNTSPTGYARVWTETWGSDVITLTSGTVGHGREVIIGSQVEMNSSAGVLWTAVSFQRVLTHEIGHTLGLGDVDIDLDGNPFNGNVVNDWYDDNYDGTNAGTQVATLSNSFAGMINTTNPEGASGLTRYAIPVSVFDVGAGNAPNILMESNGDGILALANDDFAGRQFLYPSLTMIPEPAVLHFLMAAGLLAGGRRRR